ncbi:G-specific adenine glycosylase, putative [Babesia ovis]|uniref:G-specific adenine glycosylase, putative n=1 Tax=Babesia ovis TaxID=5869 RepID=A0A9W5TDC4_BABOV|nr:G-specific adenine glycosylase, putative [Babesia ovis]
MRSGCSTHSYIFAFHITDLVLYRSLTNTLRSDYVRLTWKLAQRGSDADPWNVSEDEEVDPASRYESERLQLSGGRATDVDTVFALLRCRSDGQQKVAVKGGALSISLSSALDPKNYLATVTLNLRALDASANLNFFKVNLNDRRGLDVGHLELRYVSQQRWVKVNKRKLTFLNGQRSTGVNSMVETSLNYATSTLDGKKDSTPSGQSSLCASEVSPRTDEFVMLFWNSTNTCFVKQHPDDYQLQLMLNFIKAPSCRATTTDTWSHTARSMDLDNASRTSRTNTISQFGESMVSGSRCGANSTVLSFPNLPQALTENSGLTPSSEFTTDYGDYNDDYTNRSSLSLMTDPGSIRLFDYLSEQNRIIQSQLARQFTVDTMTSSSWTQFTGDLSSVQTSGLRNYDRGSIPGLVYQPPSPHGDLSVTMDADRITQSRQEINDQPQFEIPAANERLVMRNVDGISPPTLDIFDRSTRHSTMDNLKDSGVGNAAPLPDVSIDVPPLDLKFNGIKSKSYSDVAGNHIGNNLLPLNGLMTKPGLHMNSSLSTVDARSIGNIAQPGNSYDWYNQADVDMLHGDVPGATHHDRRTNCESLHDTESHLDIVEDVNCSVIIESETPAAISDDMIDLDRFYVEEFDFSGTVGSARNSTINDFYNDIAAVGKKYIPPSPASSTHKGAKENLVSAVYNAITADISNLSVSDLGADHVECGLDLMTEALHDARALQIQQEKLSNDLLMNFYLQLLRCHSKRGVPQVMLMEEVIQRHFAAAELLHFLPPDYNSTVIRVSLDILVRQLGMSLPAGRPSSEEPQLGTDYVAPQGAAKFWEGTIQGIAEQRTVDFFVPLSECETYSEASDADPFMGNAPDDTRRQLAIRQLHALQDEMREELHSIDVRKLVYISRLNSKPTKKRGCGLTLLAVKLALYNVFCGRRKLQTETKHIVVV